MTEERQAIGLDVRLPDKKQRNGLGGFSRKKPMAEVSVILEGGGSLDIVVPVRVGRLLSEAEGPFPCDPDSAFEYIHALEAKVALTMLTEMLGRRDHSVSEARDKLSCYGFRPEEIEPCLERARSLRFLDDARFASYFIEERKRRGWGRRKIEVELRRKGVVPADMPGYPDAFFSVDDDLERAAALLERKRVPEARPYEKLVRFLVGKGFPFDVASNAVRERLGAAGR